MKNKSLFLGLAAVVFAVGSAFSFRSNKASLVASYVNVKWSSGDPQSFCAFSTAGCSHSNSNDPQCKVSVVTTSGTRTVNAYASGCNALLTNSSSAPIIATVVNASGDPQTPFDAFDLKMP